MGIVEGLVKDVPPYVRVVGEAGSSCARRTRRPRWRGRPSLQQEVEQPVKSQGTGLKSFPFLLQHLSFQQKVRQISQSA